MDNHSSLPVGTKGTIRSLMIQELCLNASKHADFPEEKIASSQVFFQNDAVSLSCGTFLMSNRPKICSSKQSEVLLLQSSSKSAPIATYVRKKSSKPAADSSKYSTYCKCRSIQGSEEYNKRQPIWAASGQEEFMRSDQVKVVNMGCYNKGDLRMRSLAYWFGSHHHQTIAQQNGKDDQRRSMSFLKLQHYQSHHHRVPW